MRWWVIFLLFCLHAKADVLSDLFNSVPNCDKTDSEESFNQEYFESNAESEHLSWELGTPDNIPQTEVILLTPDVDEGFMY
jgi:hypothetical protein